MGVKAVDTLLPEWDITAGEGVWGRGIPMLGSKVGHQGRLSPRGQREGGGVGAAGERKRGRGVEAGHGCHRGRQGGVWDSQGERGRYRSCLWGKQRHQEDKSINEDAF